MKDSPRRTQKSQGLEEYFWNLRVLRDLHKKQMYMQDLDNELREASVIPAKAGIHPLPSVDAGLRRHDESREEPRAVKTEISSSVQTSTCSWTLRVKNFS